MKGDVPEPERRHHREGPVKTGDPGMVLPLIGHQEMEDHAEDGHHDRQHKHEFEELAEVSPCAFSLEKVADHGGVELHCAPSTG